MFASGTGSMRGPRVKTPLLLLLLLLLLTSLIQTVLCQDYDDGNLEPEPTLDPNGDGDPEIPETTPESETDPDASPEPDPSPEVFETTIEEENGSGQSLGPPDSADPSEDFTSSPPTGEPGETDGEELSVIIILIPVVLVVLIIAMIVGGIFISRRNRNRKARNQELRKDDPYLDGSSTEKVPMPMFEDDVPSVLEMEMEEFDQWMKNEGETAENSNIS